MASALKVTDLDLYEIFEILQSASVQEIKRAYRKKALKCHPDKNPDNPKAAQEWETLSKALEILTSQEARAAYDRILKARKATELRNKELESKRRKIKEDLESREAASRSDIESAAEAARRLENEARILPQIFNFLPFRSGKLRDQGSQIILEQQEILRQQMKEEEKASHADETPKLKVKWKSKKTDQSNGGYNHDALKKSFEKYGDVVNLIVSQKRNGSAIVEFANVQAAELAVAHESGRLDNPLQLTWLSGKPSVSIPVVDTAAVNDDFENQVLQRMKKAQRKKEVQKMQNGFETLETPTDLLHTSDSNYAVDENIILEKLKFVQKLKNEKNKDTDAPIDLTEDSERLDSTQTFGTSFNFKSGEHLSGMSQKFQKHPGSTSASERDFESLAMRKLRQAEERRKLIEDMEKDDN